MIMMIIKLFRSVGSALNSWLLEKITPLMVMQPMMLMMIMMIMTMMRMMRGSSRTERQV